MAVHFITVLLETTPCKKDQGVTSAECDSLTRPAFLLCTSISLIYGLAFAMLGFRILFSALMEIGPKQHLVWSGYQIVVMTMIIVEFATFEGKVSKRNINSKIVEQRKCIESK